MITPAVALKYSQLYTLGNTPAINLTRNLPQELDAEVLLLGCGDIRNILYTAYANTGFPARKYDFTCCDAEESIIARNILLLSLLIDGAVDHDLLWNISYHVLVSGADAGKVCTQAQKLLDASESLPAWKSSTYGTILVFCDEATLHDVREQWSKYANAEADFAENRAALQLSIDSRKKTCPKRARVFTGTRSAAPAAMTSLKEVSSEHEHFWKTGVTGFSKPTTPNPLIACSLSQTKLLAYGSDPILGFHLATAFTELTETSPLRLSDEGEKYKVVAAAKAQLRAWVDATCSLLSSDKLIVRSSIADVSAFCHTLQHRAVSGETTAGWYRRQFDSRILKLDDTAQTPQFFNVIDSSNLADHIGALNIMMSSLPLLSPEPFATLAIENIVHGTRDADKNMMKHLLQGHGPSVSMLLGVSAVDIWTNATSVSSVSDIMVNRIFAGRGSVAHLHTRISWRHASQLSGLGPSPALRISPDDLAGLLFQVYLNMFKHENPQSIIAAESAGMGAAARAVNFLRGSFVALLRFAKARFPTTDFEATCAALDGLIMADETLQQSSGAMQDLAAQMHLQALPSPRWMRINESPSPSQGGFKAWKTLPEVLAVTLAIPRSFIAPLYPDSQLQHVGSPTFVGSLTLIRPGASRGGYSYFGGVQLAFGTLSKHESPESDDFSVEIATDPAGWAGDAPLIASFYVPTKVLLQETEFVNIGLAVLETPTMLSLFGPLLGPSLDVYQTKLHDGESVCITKFMPGHTRYPVYSAAAKQLEQELGATPSYTVKVDDAGCVANITGRHDVLADSGKRLLKDMVPIELRQTSPYTIDVVFGKNALVLPLQFTYPVDSTQTKTRIARKSAWIEVIAPLANALTAPILDDYVYPSILGPGQAQELVPLTLNSPHVSLDTLPIMDLTNTSALWWLHPLIGCQFSLRERRLKAESIDVNEDPASARLGFKDSVGTMLTLALGIQGAQTGLFAIDHPDRGGIHMVIFVSAVKLDPAAGSIVLDAAVLPFTMDLVRSPELTEFLLILRSLDMASLTVNDAELVLWKKALPALAERARTWTHKETCEYRVKKAVPLSTEPSQPVLCSCGRGKLPKDFVAIPEWDAAAKYVTRVAISPTYSLPFIEDIVDLSSMPRHDSDDSFDEYDDDDDDDDDSLDDFDDDDQGFSHGFNPFYNSYFKDVSDSGSDSASSRSSSQPSGERCANCGMTAAMGTVDGALKKCTRCRSVVYCGTECQREDWKQHRRSCKAPE